VHCGRSMSNQLSEAKFKPSVTRTYEASRALDRCLSSCKSGSPRSYLDPWIVGEQGEDTQPDEDP